MASFKNRRIISDTGGIKILKENDQLSDTRIDISHRNPDINIIDVSRTDSSFEFFNDVTVYGKNVKSTKRDHGSIKKVGKKSLEEINQNLTTKNEVADRAKKLLTVHSTNNVRHKIRLIANNLPLLKVGDKINVNLAADNIPRGRYVVYEAERDILGTTKILVGDFPNYQILKYTLL